MAKTFFHSNVELDALYDLGLVQAGPTLCSAVARGQHLEDSGALSFGSEAARHKVCDFVGDLSLLGGHGGNGLHGHFVSWDASHGDQIAFLNCLLINDELA